MPLKLYFVDGRDKCHFYEENWIETGSGFSSKKTKPPFTMDPYYRNLLAVKFIDYRKIDNRYTGPLLFFSSFVRVQ